METVWYQFVGEDFTVIVTRLLIAIVLSGLIGFERELNNHSAGFRTHILVGVGACLMMILSLFGFTSLIDQYDNIRFDPARIPSYVISGIGFLGAGTIMVYGGTIRGLTTAASIWTVAGLGLVVGAGMYGPAVIATIIIWVSLAFLNNFEKLIRRGKSTKLLEIVLQTKVKWPDVLSIIEKHHGTIKNIEVKRVDEMAHQASIEIEWKQKVNIVDVFTEIANEEYVIRVSTGDK